MDALAWHITMKLTDQRTLVHTPADRRALSRCVWGRARSEEVVTFRAADTHVHLLFAGDRRAAGRIAHDVEVAMRWQLDLPPQFEPARLPPVRDQRHLANAFSYIVRQDLHHATGSDPLHEGGNLLDLLGLRVTGVASATTVRRLLPRIDRDELVDLFLEGLPDVPRSALDCDAERAADGLAHLREAACSAAALRDLRGKRPETVRARAAAVRVGLEFARSRRVADLLGISKTTVNTLRHRPADERLEAAIRRQLHLRAHLPAVQALEFG